MTYDEQGYDPDERCPDCDRRYCSPGRCDEPRTPGSGVLAFMIANGFSDEAIARYTGGTA